MLREVEATDSDLELGSCLCAHYGTAQGGLSKDICFKASISKVTRLFGRPRPKDQAKLQHQQQAPPLNQTHSCN